MIIYSSAALGLGIGFDNYNGARAIPIFIDAMLLVDRRQVSPLVFFDIGYSYMRFDDLPDENLGGTFINAGIGAKVKSMNEKTSFVIEPGYKNQKTAGIGYDCSRYLDSRLGGYFYDPKYTDTSSGFLTFSEGPVF